MCGGACGPLRPARSAYETRLDDNGRLLAQMLDVALAFRATHLRALAAAQTIAAHPGAVSKTPPMMDDSVFSAALLCPDADWASLDALGGAPADWPEVPLRATQARVPPFAAALALPRPRRTGTSAQRAQRGFVLAYRHCSYLSVSYRSARRHDECVG
jgi:hypothetical protein